MRTPPTAPVRTASQILTKPSPMNNWIKKYAAMINKTADPMVPVLKAASGDIEENALTIIIPKTEAINPIEASARGKSIIPESSKVDAIAIEAIIAPQ